MTAGTGGECGVCGGLEGGQGGGLWDGGFLFGFFFVGVFFFGLFFVQFIFLPALLQDALHQKMDGAFGPFGFAEFGARGEDAEGGVDGDLFDGLDWCCGLAVALGGGLSFGEVEAGDLEAVEQQAGAARIDVVGGDALEDFADGGLDGGTVFRQRQVEGGAAAAALFWVGDGFSRGVVVVAELLAAQTGAGAAVAVGEDVAALVLLR